jgi:tetratricopeptide (TPR) repeat protein
MKNKGLFLARFKAIVQHRFSWYMGGVLLVFLFSVKSSWATSANAVLWNQANHYYEKAMYDSALLCYNKIETTEKASAQLYFNIANTHYQLHHVGMAIWAYQKALQLQPKNEAAQENLRLAQGNIKEPLLIPQEKGLALVFNWMKYKMSSNLWASLALIVFLILAYLLYRIKVQQKVVEYYRRWNVVLSIIWLTSVLLAFATHYYQHEARGVILVHQTRLLQAPQMAAKEIIPIPEGTTVNITSYKQGFVEILLTNGVKGWVPQSTIGNL